MAFSKQSSQEIWEECRMKMKNSLRREITTELEKKYGNEIASLREEIKRIQKELDNKCNCGKNNNDNLRCTPAPEKPVDVPLVLRPDFENSLARIVSKMDMNTFLHFIRTSKKIYHLAQSGSLKIQLNLSVHLVCINAVAHVSSHLRPFLIYGNRILNEVDIYNIRKSKCFSVEIDKLDVHSIDLVHKYIDLFNLIGVQKIHSVYCSEESKELFHDLTQNFEIRRLELAHIPVILNSPPPCLLKLEELRITSAPTPVSDEQKKIVRKFVLSSSDVVVFQFFGSLPCTLISSLLEKWVSRERNWEFISFQADVSEISPQALVSDFARNMKLRTFTCREKDGPGRYLQSDVVPALIKENHVSFILIRGDTAKITVTFSNEYKWKGGRKIRQLEVRQVI